VAQLAEALLARCPGLRLVVTSRRPLGVAGEAVHVLGPLATPPAGADLATVAASPAVLLLRDRIADRAPALVQGEVALLRLAEFTRRLDGVPLTLQLLAAQAPGRSLDQLAALLEAPQRLGSDDAGLAPRHRSMQDTVGWSLDRLPDEEQRALRRLSVFAGRFEPPAARAVVGNDVDADAALHALVRDAVVHVERTESGLSFRLLRPVRDIARERLVEAGELEATVRRHRRWHADRWRGSKRSDALLYDVRDHYPDYLVALAGAHEAGDREQVVDLSTTLGFLWIFADMLGPCLRWCTRAIDSGLLSPLDQARLLRTRGVLQSNHDPEQGRRDLEAAIPVLSEHGDVMTLAGAHYALALERSHSGDDAAALEHARIGVQAARLAQEDERLADALTVQAIVAAELEPAEAESAAEEAWELASRSGSLLALSGVAINLVWAHMAMGHPQVALDLVARVHARLPEGDVPDFLRFVGGWALLLTGDARAAVAEFSDVIASHEDALEGRWLATCYLGAAVGLAALGHPLAPELLAGAEANWARVGTAPAPWQERLLATARDQAAAIGPPPWGADNTPGSTLAALVRAASADAATI
jgi:predicted ATPase